MLNRNNAVGFIFLGACAVVAGIMIYFIATGERPSVNFGPVGNAIGFGIFLLLMVVMFLRSPLGQRLRGGRSRRDTPDSGTGPDTPWKRLDG